MAVGTMHAPNYTKKRNGRVGYIVMYRDAQGTTHEARVVSAGTNSGLKLRIDKGFRQSQRVVDDVPLATSLKSTNAYFNRLP